MRGKTNTAARANMLTYNRRRNRLVGSSGPGQSAVLLWKSSLPVHPTPVDIRRVTNPSPLRLSSIRHGCECRQKPWIESSVG